MLSTVFYILILQFITTSLANTCYNEISCFTEDGEHVRLYCSGSSSVYPPIWTGVAKSGKRIQSDEYCNFIANRRELKMIGFPGGNNESSPLNWCCGSDNPDVSGSLFKVPVPPDVPDGAPIPPQFVSNLVLLIRFSDHKTSPLKPRSAYEQFFNGKDFDPDYSPTGSVKHYFLRQSYSKVEVHSMVVGWVDVTISETEAAAGCSALCTSNKLWDAIIEALDYAASTIEDFSQLDLDGDKWLDGLTIIHSGFSAETGGIDINGKSSQDRIWSHKWGLDRTWNGPLGIRANRYNANPGNFGLDYTVGITRIGVVAHELGHFFGLPDLYDLDFSSSGIHVYGAMASAWGVDGSQYYPQSLSPWCKYQLGWIKPKLLSQGTNHLYPGNADSDNEIFLLTKNYPSNEKIFIEYRQAREWDQLLPGGVLIWHSDDSAGSNRNEWYPELGLPTTRFLVRLIQADGLFKLEKFQWPERDDPGVFWSGNTILSDLSGENTLLPYKEHIQGADCMTTGNTLSEFYSQNNGDYYTMVYTLTDRVPCDGSETNNPTPLPSREPTDFPTKNPTTTPPTTTRIYPTSYPTTPYPTAYPTTQPVPTSYPTQYPTTAYPTFFPTSEPVPTAYPTQYPTTAYPTLYPTAQPVPTSYPTQYPTTGYPTSYPTPPPVPTSYPTQYPTTGYPTSYPTNPSGEVEKHVELFPDYYGYY